MKVTHKQGTITFELDGKVILIVEDGHPDFEVTQVRELEGYHKHIRDFINKPTVGNFRRMIRKAQEQDCSRSFDDLVNLVEAL